MQKNHAVEHSSLQKYFSDFCKDAELLPDKTPIFMTDSRMRVVIKRGQIRWKDHFENLGGLLPQKEFEFYLSVRKNNDAAAVFLDDGKSKEFAVISKIGGGFSRCVVCCYGEEMCKGLSDYYQKLCSYKDYLDLFSSVVCSNYPKMPVISVLKMRLSGVYHLMNMAFCKPSTDKVRESAIPFITALEKLAGFVEKTSSDFGDTCKIYIDGENVPVMLSVGLMNILVSCMGFVMRNSKDGKLFLNVSEKDRGIAVLSMSVNGCGDAISSIYKDHMLGMLDELGISYRYSKNTGSETFDLELKRASVKDAVISEPEKVQTITDGCLDQKWLEDVIYTIIHE